MDMQIMCSGISWIPNIRPTPIHGYREWCSYRRRYDSEAKYMNIFIPYMEQDVILT